MRFVEDSPHSVELVLRVLGIASSTYYWWRKRLQAPSARQIADEPLLAEIVDIHTSSGGSYGSPRVHAMLARRGIAVGRKRVERIMRGAGLHTRSGRTRLHRRSPEPPVGGGCDPHPVWSWRAFWLAAVRDAFSNRIVGWKASDRCDPELVLGALEYAVWSRDIRDGELIHHSDRGPTYTAIRFANRLSDNGITQSMGSVGDSYDNALMENFFSTLKTELVYRRSWRTRDEAENALCTYIDGWYNTQRIQKKLGWKSPDEFEASYNHPVSAESW